MAPLPFAPALPWMVIHGTDGCDVQAHVEPDAVTVMSPVPPSLENDPLVGATVKVQGVGVGVVPAWVTVITVPAT
jgi:hypothetical protein